mmetsp:Transcript_44714/g.106104  ORF Transcript_44714/g.106104 Transcript_44714/m.106104 type:complete len:380 (-) Transcript_44714:86-1225(-)|eukprot:CAMPEP_0178418478 /NCGR_PEP_ID=MMETSP0689_2-20121128/25107_1 /TAXON_ID=160604 /ORGANISM="Amphidinium massartii, Strain CS-259" /LENGTH=379 /DNA_ID=CAMNT_0020039869 /DNA_START=72 /DNA_END=1214 /DNA_ORIENTATION=+
MSNTAAAIKEREKKSEARLAKQKLDGSVKFVKEQIGLKKNAWMAPFVEEYMQKLLAAGWAVPSAAVLPAGVGDAAASANQGGGSGSSGGPVASIADGNEGEAPSGADKKKGKKSKEQMMAKEFVHQNKFLQSQTVNDLTFILEYAEPLLLNSCSLKQLCTHGAKEVTKDRLCEVIEFISNVSGSDEVYEVYDNLGALAVFVAEQNVQRGRPANRHSLAVPWQEDGVYKAEVCPTGVCVVNLITGQRAVLSLDMLKMQNFRAPLEGLYIDKNFSEKRAALKQQKSPASLPLLGVLGMALPAVQRSPGGQPRPKQMRALPAPAAAAALVDESPVEQSPESQESPLREEESVLAEAATAALEQEEREPSEPPSPSAVGAEST